jgi:hypothetical protein
VKGTLLLPSHLSTVNYILQLQLQFLNRGIIVEQAEARNMPTTNSITLLNICRVIEQTPDEGLLAIDRDALAATTKALKALGQEVDRTLQRLARIDREIAQSERIAK